jgi:hypothetical protein
MAGLLKRNRPRVGPGHSIEPGPTGPVAGREGPRPEEDLDKPRAAPPSPRSASTPPPATARGYSDHPAGYVGLVADNALYGAGMARPGPHECANYFRAAGYADSF